MRRTAIILAGGRSGRLGQDKGLVLLAGKPLISYIFKKVYEIVGEVIIVVSSRSQKESFSQIFPKGTKIFADTKDVQGPLIGALSGFVNASGEYSILLPCDTPFISKEVISLLFELSKNVNAVIPRWPNGYIEPLQAVYRTCSALTAARLAVERRWMRMWSMISLLKKVRYISTMVIREIDPHLNTFFNVNTPLDLKRAERLIRRRIAN